VIGKPISSKFGNSAAEVPAPLNMTAVRAVIEKSFFILKLPSLEVVCDLPAAYLLSPTREVSLFTDGPCWPSQKRAFQQSLCDISPAACSVECPLLGPLADILRAATNACFWNESGTHSSKSAFPEQSYVCSGAFAMVTAE
jgi:hypothetical protein